MANAILSVDEFLQKLNVGDKFWYMGSYLEKPSGTYGPYTVLSIFLDEQGKWRVRYRNEETGRENSATSPDYADDLTNRWHGVFLSEKDANAYFEERVRAYETDPKLIAEHELAVADAKMWQEYEESFWESEIGTDL